MAGSTVAAQILQFAYQDDGSSIVVGDTGASEANVPEPGTNALLLLTLGAAGVMQMRARKKQVEKAEKEVSA